MKIYAVYFRKRRGPGVAEVYEIFDNLVAANLCKEDLLKIYPTVYIVNYKLASDYHERTL